PVPQCAVDRATAFLLWRGDFGLSAAARCLEPNSRTLSDLARRLCPGSGSLTRRRMVSDRDSAGFDCDIVVDQAARSLPDEASGAFRAWRRGLGRSMPYRLVS